MRSQLIPSAHRAPQFFEGIKGIVRINEKVLATTNQNAQYTELVKHSDHLEELEYDWDYNLYHWIKNSTDSDSVVSMLSSSIIETQLIKDKKSRSVDKKHSGSKPSHLKCDICNLEFDEIKCRHNMSNYGMRLMLLENLKFQ